MPALVHNVIFKLALIPMPLHACMCAFRSDIDSPLLQVKSLFGQLQVDFKVMELDQLGARRPVRVYPCTWSSTWSPHVG